MNFLIFQKLTAMKVFLSKMKAGVILLCTVDNLYQEFKIEGAELEMYQNLFLGRVKKFYEMSNTS